MATSSHKPVLKTLLGIETKQKKFRMQTTIASRTDDIARVQHMWNENPRMKVDDLCKMANIKRSAFFLMRTKGLISEPVARGRQAVAATAATTTTVAAAVGGTLGDIAALLGEFESMGFEFAGRGRIQAIGTIEDPWFDVIQVASIFGWGDPDDAVSRRQASLTLLSWLELQNRFPNELTGPARQVHNPIRRRFTDYNGIMILLFDAQHLAANRQIMSLFATLATQIRLGSITKAKEQAIAASTQQLAITEQRAIHAEQQLAIAVAAAVIDGHLYRLVEVDSGRVDYIGKSIHVGRRIQEHECSANRFRREPGQLVDKAIGIDPDRYRWEIDPTVYSTEAALAEAERAAIDAEKPRLCRDIDPDRPFLCAKCGQKFVGRTCRKKHQDRCRKRSRSEG